MAVIKVQKYIPVPDFPQVVASDFEFACSHGSLGNLFLKSTEDLFTAGLLSSSRNLSPTVTLPVLFISSSSLSSTTSVSYSHIVPVIISSTGSESSTISVLLRSRFSNPVSVNGLLTAKVSSKSSVS